MKSPKAQKLTKEGKWLILANVVTFVLVMVFGWPASWWGWTLAISFIYLAVRGVIP